MAHKNLTAGGRLLRAWRKENRWSGPSLGRQLGVSRGRVYQLEVDPANGPSLELAQRIEKFTGGAVPVSAWEKQFAVMVDPAEAERGAA